jgi:hypothetical protein
MQISAQNFLKEHMAPLVDGFQDAPYSDETLGPFPFPEQKLLREYQARVAAIDTEVRQMLEKNSEIIQKALQVNGANAVANQTHFFQNEVEPRWKTSSYISFYEYGYALDDSDPNKQSTLEGPGFNMLFEIDTTLGDEALVALEIGHFQAGKLYRGLTWQTDIGEWRKDGKFIIDMREVNTTWFGRRMQFCSQNNSQHPCAKIYDFLGEAQRPQSGKKETAHPLRRMHGLLMKGSEATLIHQVAA